MICIKQTFIQHLSVDRDVASWSARSPGIIYSRGNSKGKQHANVPYGKRVKLLSSEVSHTRCFRFVVIYMLLTKINQQAGRSAHSRGEKKKKREKGKKNHYSHLNVIREYTLQSEGCGLWSVADSLFFSAIGNAYDAMEETRYLIVDDDAFRHSMRAVALFAVYFWVLIFFEIVNGNKW